jgi:outer membrane cobalamin receptor
LGGCINIIPENPKYDKDAIAVSYGSFNEIFLSIYNARKMGDFSLGLSAEYKHSDGNYPININHFGENSVVNRTNAEFNNYSLTLNSQYQINKSIELNSFILLFNSQRGVPGAVLQGHIESLNSEYSESGALINIGNNIRLSDNIIFNTTYNLKVNQIHYRDKNLIGYGGKILDNKFNSLDNTLIFGLKNISQQSTFLFNTELFHSDLKGDMLQTDISSNPERYGIALSQVYEYNDILSEKFKYNISLAFRTDIFNDNSPAYSPFLGLIIQPVNSDLSLKMNISRNFRMPSFNELYYLNYGTANLKPEKSNSINLGMAYNFGNINLELNSFLTHTEDLILAVPKSPVSWSAQNIGMASYKGIEVIAAYYMESNKLSANANYTLQFAEDISDNSINYQKQLVYVPYEMLNLNLSFELWDIQTAINLNYTGFRYSLQSNDISSVLDSYTTLNLKFSKEIKFDSKKLLISAQADNLTSENFEIVKNYPMPGRIFRLGVLFSTNSNPQM